MVVVMKAVIRLSKPVLAIFVVFLGTLNTASANELGVGLVTPVPTGITFKLWFDKTNAFDIVGSWNINDQKYYVHADYLTHDYSKFALEHNVMAFYYGFGARLKQKNSTNSDTVLGMRIPFGLSYFLESAPFEIFGEVAPRLDVTPYTHFGMDLMLGIRFRISPNT
jgi:hypothetical protein